MEVGLKWCTTICNKIFKSSRPQKEAYAIFGVIMKPSTTTESMKWSALEFIYFQTIISFYFKFFVDCRAQTIPQ